jgi:hypothetical protein
MALAHIFAGQFLRVTDLHFDPPLADFHRPNLLQAL